MLITPKYWATMRQNLERIFGQFANFDCTVNQSSVYRAIRMYEKLFTQMLLLLRGE